MQHFQTRLFFAYLLLTIIFELPVLFLSIRKIFKLSNQQVTNRSLFLCGFLCTFATYPYVWYVFPALITDQFIALIVAEIVVILVESLIVLGILKLDFFRAFLVSLMCNLTSIILGTVMNKLILDYRLFLF